MAQAETSQAKNKHKSPKTVGAATTNSKAAQAGKTCQPYNCQAAAAQDLSTAQAVSQDFSTVQAVSQAATDDNPKDRTTKSTFDKLTENHDEDTNESLQISGTKSFSLTIQTACLFVFTFFSQLTQ